MFTLGSLAVDITALLVTTIVIIITYYKWTFSYWKRRNLDFLTPTIPFGNLESPFSHTEMLGYNLRRPYNEFKKRKLPHGGIYFLSKPEYVPVDLELVKSILTKDFHHFVDRGIYYNEETDPLSAHLFAIGGQKWKNLRTKLTPTFTSGKMKMMFQTLVDCEENLLQKVETLTKKGDPVDIKEVLGCFTTDIIGSCAFGLDCNTFKEEDSLFRKYGKKVFVSTNLQRLRMFFSFTFPSAAKSLGILAVDSEVSKFFMKVVKDTVEYREKNNVSRKDFLQLLMELKNKGEEHKHDGKSLTIEEVAAQCFVFFLAGFETSSTAMTFALYELAKNPEIQNKVREEIERVLAKHGGKITYEGIQEMKYMDQVLNETLRKYPPLPLITRECVLDYKVPDQDLVIEKGTGVLISIYGIHHDEDYYPNPEKFDPERFNEENSKNRHPYAHIPFGEGPRVCIGLRFGLMQSKIGLTSLLQKYKFTVNKKTKEPLEFVRNSIVLAADGDMWLNAEKI